MTQKDFIAIANALRKTRPTDSADTQWGCWERNVNAIADVFQAENPRFNRGHFLRYCNDTTGMVPAKGLRPK